MTNLPPSGRSYSIPGDIETILNHASELLNIEPQELVILMLRENARSLLDPLSGMLQHWAEEGIEYSDEAAANEAARRVREWMEWQARRINF